MTNPWTEVIVALYDGVPDGMPKYDWDQLEAIATWLDTVDDASDRALAATVRAPVERTIQASLRRIADTLREDRCDFDCDYCRS